jgi:hypothetical protein
LYDSVCFRDKLNSQIKSKLFLILLLLGLWLLAGSEHGGMGVAFNPAASSLLVSI